MAGASGSSEAFGSSKRGEQRLSGVVGTTNDDRAVTKRRQRLVRFEREMIKENIALFEQHVDGVSVSV